MSLSPKKAHVAVSILGVKGHSGGLQGRIQGRIQRGEGGLGVRTSPIFFFLGGGGEEPPHFIKRGKNVACVLAKTPHLST